MRNATRTETRKVPVERGGRTHMVDRDFTVTVPRVPRDWDAVALRAVSGAAALAVAGAVTWSTVAIGALLSETAPAWSAYLAAGMFDLAWIVCMVLEWLSRYDRGRATLPVFCGWVFLGISVGLITFHGHHAGNWIVGACGGAVSLLAKGMWTVVMRHSAVTMDADSQAWMDAERAAYNSRQAMTAARRQLTRTEARTTAMALALSAGQPGTWTAVQDSPVPATVSVLSGTDRTEDSPPVVRDSGQDRTQDSVSVPDSRTVSVSGALSQRAFVRGLLSADPGLSDTDLSSAVRSEYGQDTKADSIRKAIQRARGDLSRTA